VVASIENLCSLLLAFLLAFWHEMAWPSSNGVPGLKCASGEERHWTRRAYRRGKKYQLEQVLNLLRQIEVAAANGKTTAQACKEARIVEQTYFR